MTRHRLAQIAEKVNPKSPENRHQTRRFLRNRLLHARRLPARRQSVSHSSRTTSYDIVTQQHGGTIEVDSRVGECTEFTIRLPRSTQVARTGAAA
jgi:hypothetical protein